MIVVPVSNSVWDMGKITSSPSPAQCLWHNNSHMYQYVTTQPSPHYLTLHTASQSSHSYRHTFSQQRLWTILVGDWDLGFETMVLFTRYITHISLGLSNVDP